MKLSSVLLLLAPVLISCDEVFLPADCSDILHHVKNPPSGVYTIYPICSTPRSAVEVYCDMDSNGGGWTVFQRRMDGSVNFYRPWDQYKIGFGAASGEYWLGLENIYQLTSRKHYELLVNVEDFDGNKKFATYSSFKVDDEFSGYQLHVSGYQGDAGDGMDYHDGQKFSTLDKDQDSSSESCARKYVGAFWYNNCYGTNPNGVYRWGNDNTLFAVGMTWFYWRGFDYSMKSISFKIRPAE